MNDLFLFYVAFFKNLSSVFLFLFNHHILEFSTVKFRRPSGQRLSELESEYEASFIITCSCSSTAISFVQRACCTNFPRIFAVPILRLLGRGVE